MKEVFPILINKLSAANYQFCEPLCSDEKNGNFPSIYYGDLESIEQHAESAQHRSKMREQSYQNLRNLQMDEWAVLTKEGETEPLGLMQKGSPMTASLILDRLAMANVQNFFQSKMLIVGIPCQSTIIVSSFAESVAALNSRFFNEAMLDDNQQALIPQLLYLKEGKIMGNFNIINGSLNKFITPAETFTRRIARDKSGIQVSSDTISLKKINRESMPKPKTKGPVKKRFKLKR